MDYQIFLVTRMHKAHRHGAAPLHPIRTGFGQVVPVVLSGTPGADGARPS
jgi:RND superfamily putative drug exporter